MNGLTPVREEGPVKKIMILFICAALLISGCGADETLEYSTSSDTDIETLEEREEIPESIAEEVPEELIYVYICGAVNSPGVYELKAGSRIFQAVEAAGGLTADADEKALNQARILTDGEQITVLTHEEAAESGESGTAGAQEQGQDNGLVNINRAGISELMSLPGIGEAKAAAIISYREANGAFASIDEICSVEGIKEKLFSRISSLITV